MIKSSVPCSTSDLSAVTIPPLDIPKKITRLLCNVQRRYLQLASGLRYTPKTIRSRFWKWSQIAFIELFDLEAGIGDKRRNMPGYVAALECQPEERFDPPLPLLHGRIRSEAVLTPEA